MVGISFGLFKHDSVTLETMYHVCFGNCGCDLIRESKAGVIMFGRCIGGIGDVEGEVSLESWSDSRSEFVSPSRMTYRERCIVRVGYKNHE
jgi:hypothetical protein